MNGEIHGEMSTQVNGGAYWQGKPSTKLVFHGNFAKQVEKASDWSDHNI